MRWCKANESILVNREPVASVGVLWSQRNTDFFGRDQAGDLVDAPYTGIMHALVRARIPYLPVHADELAGTAGRFSVLILPNVGGLSDEQCESIRAFVRNGGSLLATGASSLYNEWGDARPDYTLADSSLLTPRHPPSSWRAHLEKRRVVAGRATGPRPMRIPICACHRNCAPA